LGEAAKEKAAHLCVNCPEILGGIVHDVAASPRHRIGAVRELRACAAVGLEANTPAGDKRRFVININFGGKAVHKNWKSESRDLGPTVR
jgi:hypothetical protein